MIKQPFLAILVLLACCVALMQGMPTSLRERCLCRGVKKNSVEMDRVSKVEYHQPTSSCGQEELLVFLKNNGQRRCLNTHGMQGRRIIETHNQHLKDL